MLTNLPNLLTMSRIVVIPVIIGLLFIDASWARWAAFALYATAAITDFFDGYLARAMEQMSEFGRFLDPIADKLLVTSVILMICANGALDGYHVIAAVIILIREVLISGMREFLAGSKIIIHVTKLAKWKTFIQMIALGFLIVGDAAPDWIPADPIGTVGIWVAALLTAWTGIDYLRAGMGHIIEAEKKLQEQQNKSSEEKNT